MQGTIHKRTVATAILVGILIVYFAAVCMINFSGIPAFYDTDMYADIYYSMKVWQSRSIFPDNWVFGNQLNAVSAPVLASLIYGVAGDPVLAMGIAATVMSLFVVLSMDWMLKAVFCCRDSRLTAVVVLMALVLFCGGAIEGNIGWSMLFTMCSYYSGYIIAAFLAFGIYLRPDILSSRKGILLFGLTCILSFGTGIQSIRQTVVMVVPLVAVEGLQILMRLFRNGWKNCLNRTSLIVVGGIALSNLLGLIFVRMIEINQVEILGSLQFNSLSKIPAELKQAVVNICALVLNESADSFAVMCCVGAVCVLAAVLILKHSIHAENHNALLLFLLLTVSVLVIAAIDVMLAMIFASRYYFMIFPLMAYLVAYCFDSGKKQGRYVLLCMVALLAAFAGVKELAAPCATVMKGEPDRYAVVSEYLVDQGHRIVFTEWDHGEKAAVASRGKVTASFWLDRERPFVPVEYLSDPAVVASDPEDCVYLFDGDKAVTVAMEAAQSKGISLELLHYFPESDIYLYTAPVNLMLLFQ